MSVKVEKLEHNMVKLTVEVPAASFIGAITRAYKKQKKNISIPGFRKGHAPQQLIEKMYGASIFYEDAVNDCINETWGKETAETGLTFVSRPEFDVEQVEKGSDLIYTATVAVRPEVKLGEYKGIEVKKSEISVTDEEIEAEINSELDKNSRLVEVTDRAVMDGDTVTIDYSGSIDGEKFDGGTAEGHELVIGSGQFIPGFEEQIVGMNCEETKDITVTFPAEYHAADLAGKEAVFTCTVHKIQKKELPELNDEFAQDVSEYDTLDEYRNSIREDLTKKKEEQAKTERENEAVDKLIEASEMDIPEAMVDYEVIQMYQNYAQRLQSQGIPIDMYLQYTGSSEAQLKEQMKPQALKQIQTRLVREEVVKAENITVTDERIDEEIAKMAERYQMEADKLKELMGDFEKEQMQKDLAVQDALTLIAENAKEV